MRKIDAFHNHKNGLCKKSRILCRQYRKRGGIWYDIIESVQEQGRDEEEKGFGKAV